MEQKLDFTSEGFIKVEFNRSEKCNFLITSLTGEVFETESLPEDILKNKSKFFWIKYHALRRMSKCENSMPIQITDYRLN